MHTYRPSAILWSIGHRPMLCVWKNNSRSAIGHRPIKAFGRSAIGPIGRRPAYDRSATKNSLADMASAIRRREPTVDRPKALLLCFLRKLTTAHVDGRQTSTCTLLQYFHILTLANSIHDIRAWNRRSGGADNTAKPRQGRFIGLSRRSPPRAQAYYFYRIKQQTFELGSFF